MGGGGGTAVLLNYEHMKVAPTPAFTGRGAIRGTMDLVRLGLLGFARAGR